MTWTAQATSTHQDHVIAHVIGATVLGYFVFDESIYLLLDIGFFWRVYLDGEMGLLPYSVMIGELETDLQTKEQLRLDSDKLVTGRGSTESLKQIMMPPCECMIGEVSFFGNGQDWKLVIRGEQGDFEIESSLATREFIVSRHSE